MNQERNKWLFPDEEFSLQAAPDPRFPDFIVPATPKGEKLLQTRNLTKLYNENPAWLKKIHNELDVAVAKLYGISNIQTDKEIFDHLLNLNMA